MSSRGRRGYAAMRAQPRAKETQVLVRPGARGDLEQVADIYAYYVRETHVTFDLEPPSVDAWHEWFDAEVEPGRFDFVVAVEDERVLGFARSGSFHSRPGYDTSVATAIYCARDACGRGIGSALYGALFEAIAARGLHRAFAGIALPNDASIALHEKLGFTYVGTYSEPGQKFGRYWDVSWYEKKL